MHHSKKQQNKNPVSSGQDEETGEEMETVDDDDNNGIDNGDDKEGRGDDKEGGGDDKDEESSGNENAASKGGQPLREITVSDNHHDDDVSHTLTTGNATEMTATTSKKSANKKKGSRSTGTSNDTSMKIFVRDIFFSCEKFVTQMERVLSNQQPTDPKDKQTGKVYRMLEEYLLEQLGKKELTDFAWTIKEMKKFCGFLNHKRGEVSMAIKTEIWSELFVGRVVFFAPAMAKLTKMLLSFAIFFLSRVVRTK